VRVARGVALTVALAGAALGVWRGTWAVGGSDSSCYALMAQSFAHARLQPALPLAREVPWRNAPRTFAPGGFIPSPVRPDAAAPVCAPGFALVLAPFYVVGGRDAIFVVTPLAGALLIYLTFSLGRQLAGSLAGLTAAVIVAAAPVFVFQVVQPMNDVVVAALWAAAVTLASRPSDHGAAIGAVTGLAVLIRPNLAPAALCVAAWCYAGGVRQLAHFVALFSPFVAALLALNAWLYGHPLATGYGSVEALFALSHVADNAVNFGRSLLVTQLGFPLLGLVGIFFVPPHQRRLAMLLTGVAVTNIAVYLFYQPLVEWWYLRFLLPALPILVVLAMAALVHGSRRPSVAVPVAATIVLYAVTSNSMRDALDLSRLERRFRAAGAVAREHLPDDAVIFTVWESGTVRYHANREAVLWDSLDPNDFDLAVAWLTMHQHEPWLMIEDWEEPLFRERFAGQSAIGELDWPPRFEIERRVKLFQLADRARYYAGQSIPTQFVRSDR
jgi:hypothetical protein